MNGSRRFFLWIGVWLTSMGGAWPAPAIPAPDAVFYGLVTNGGSAVAPTGVVWTVTGNAETLVSSNTTVVVINGDAFYISRVRFEQRQLGASGLSAMAGTLALTDSATAYTRSAAVDGQAATLPAGAGSFQMGAGLLGLIERIDLVVGGVETFEQWSQRIFGRLVDPNGDEDGDGESNYSEYAAGTDPTDPRSRWFVRGFKALPGGAFTFSWDSIEDRAYRVERSTDLRNWTNLLSGVAGTGGPLCFTNSPVPGAKRLFFRVIVAEP